jgi:DNA-binding IclR family transcriptional regulator
MASKGRRGDGKSREPKKPAYTTPAVEKAFAILEMFATENRGYTISEVSRFLRLPISTASSLLYTLQSCGYAQRDSEGRFFLTMKMLVEGNKALSQMSLRDVARSELQRVRETTGLTVYFAVRDFDHAVYIDKLDGGSLMRPVYHVGQRMHMHHSATGKVLLAYLSDEQVGQIAERTGLPKSTANTLSSLTALKDHLTRVRAQGYAIDDEETMLGLRGVAAPIFDHNGRVVAALGAGGTVFEVSGNIRDIIDVVKGSAAELSIKLGYHETSIGAFSKVPQLKTTKGGRIEATGS